VCSLDAGIEINVGLLSNFARLERALFIGVQRGVPQQCAALSLLGLERGLGLLQLIDEQRGFRDVFGAGKQ
jgi:hypothetical protein